MMAARRAPRPRLDYEVIEDLVPDGARVLDLGCGDGALLAALVEHKGCVGRGIEIAEEAVRECVRKGLAVYHGDMTEGMSFYRDGQFDVVVLSQTLQQTLRPPEVIHEMLRVGRQAIISFPNFGHWRVRLGLVATGRMPRTRLLPYHWFNTPNVHLCTIRDFREFCDREGLRRVTEIFLSPANRRIGPVGANWRAGLAIFQIEKRAPAAGPAAAPAGSPPAGPSPPAAPH